METEKSATSLATEIARRMKAARMLTGKPPTELAADLGWSKEKLYRFESGRQSPSALQLAHFARVTGQPIGFFYPTPSPGDATILSSVASPVNDGVPA